MITSIRSNSPPTGIVLIKQNVNTIINTELSKTHMLKNSKIGDGEEFLEFTLDLEIPN